MSSPVDDRPEPTYTHPSYNTRSSLDRGSRERALPSYNINNQHRRVSIDKSSDGEGTTVDGSEHTYEKPNQRLRPGTDFGHSHHHLSLQTEHEPYGPEEALRSPSQ